MPDSNGCATRPASLAPSCRSPAGRRHGASCTTSTRPPKLGCGQGVRMIRSLYKVQRGIVQWHPIDFDLGVASALSMTLPRTLVITGGWIALWIANALLVPVAMMLLDLPGGLLSAFTALALIVAAAFIVLLGAVHAWRTGSPKAFFLDAFAPAIFIGLTVLLLTNPALELSSQVIHGPRYAPRWR